MANFRASKGAKVTASSAPGVSSLSIKVNKCS